jgi:hypothetical protein
MPTSVPPGSTSSIMKSRPLLAPMGRCAFLRRRPPSSRGAPGPPRHARRRIRLGQRRAQLEVQPRSRYGRRVTVRVTGHRRGPLGSATGLRHHHGVRSPPRRGDHLRASHDGGGRVSRTAQLPWHVPRVVIDSHRCGVATGARRARGRPTPWTPRRPDPRPTCLIVGFLTPPQPLHHRRGGRSIPWAAALIKVAIPYTLFGTGTNR